MKKKKEKKKGNKRKYGTAQDSNGLDPDRLLWVVCMHFQPQGMLNSENQIK